VENILWNSVFWKRVPSGRHKRGHTSGKGWRRERWTLSPSKIWVIARRMD